MASRSRKTNCPNKKMKASTNQRTNFTTADRSTTRPDTVFSPTKMPFFLHYSQYCHWNIFSTYLATNYPHSFGKLWGQNSHFTCPLPQEVWNFEASFFLSLFLLWLLTWTNLRKYINNSNYKSWILIAFPWNCHWIYFDLGILPFQRM